MRARTENSFPLSIWYDLNIVSVNLNVKNNGDIKINFFIHIVFIQSNSNECLCMFLSNISKIKNRSVTFYIQFLSLVENHLYACETKSFSSSYYNVPWALQGSSPTLKRNECEGKRSIGSSISVARESYRSYLSRLTRIRPWYSYGKRWMPSITRAFNDDFVSGLFLLITLIL